MVPDPRGDLARRPLVASCAGSRARGRPGPACPSPQRRARAWPLVASLVGVCALLALAAGPLVGALLIFATDAPLALLNFVAGIVYAVAMPFVAITTAYVYFDARARVELERSDDPAELPAEIELSAT